MIAKTSRILFPTLHKTQRLGLGLREDTAEVPAARAEGGEGGGVAAQDLRGHGHDRALQQGLRASLPHQVSTS